MHCNAQGGGPADGAARWAHLGVLLPERTLSLSPVSSDAKERLEAEKHGKCVKTENLEGAAEESVR